MASNSQRRSFARLTKLGRTERVHGLIRSVMPSGSKQWAQTAWILGHGPPIRPRKYPVLSLAEAQVANPKIEGFSELAMNLWRRRPRTHQRSRSASRVIEIRDRNSQSAKHAVQWTAMLGEYVFLVFGLKRVDLEPTNRGFADHHSNHCSHLIIRGLTPNGRLWDPAWDPLYQITRTSACMTSISTEVLRSVQDEIEAVEPGTSPRCHILFRTTPLLRCSRSPSRTHTIPRSADSRKVWCASL